MHIRFGSVIWGALVLAGTMLGTTSGVTRGAGSLELQDNPIPQDNPISMSEDSIAAGRVVYARFCASCHGREGRGDGTGAFGDVPPANLVDDEWVHGESDVEIFTTIAEGVPPDYNMEEWRGRITDDDIWNIINFLRSLATP